MERKKAARLFLAISLTLGPGGALLGLGAAHLGEEGFPALILVVLGSLLVLAGNQLLGNFFVRVMGEKK